MFGSETAFCCVATAYDGGGGGIAIVSYKHGRICDEMKYTQYVKLYIVYNVNICKFVFDTVMFVALSLTELIAKSRKK